MSIFIFAVFHIRDSEYKIYDLESRTDRNYRVKPVLLRFLFQHLLFFLFFLAFAFLFSIQNSPSSDPHNCNLSFVHQEGTLSSLFFLFIYLRATSQAKPS
jgi:hypothetical protein